MRSGKQVGYMWIQEMYAKSKKYNFSDLMTWNEEVKVRGGDANKWKYKKTEWD